MRNLYFPLGICLLLASCTPDAPKTSEPQLEPAKHIVVIGVDGMSPDGILNANTPNMDYLMENGSYTLHARAVLPTSSSSNWASMIMGAGPEQHGITSNGWERDDYILPPVTVGPDKVVFPTIFGVVREQMPEAEIGAIYHWGGFGRLFEKAPVNYDIHVEGEQETTDEACKYIKEKKPSFTFIHLDHVDGAGHGAGHGTPEYYAAVESADKLIGQIHQAVKDAGMEGETIILVTSDHGGIGTGHGGETLAEIEIPFILYGKNIKKGKEIMDMVYTYDNAATVAFAFNLAAPQAWIGRPVKTAFNGYPDGSPKNMALKATLLAPTIYPPRDSYDPPGGLFIDETPTVELKSKEEGVTIRYTLDGTDPTENSPEYTVSFQVEKTCVVKVRAFKGNNRPSPVETGYFRLFNSGGDNGINYSYYEGQDLHFVPDFKEMKPVKTGKVPEFRLSHIEHRDDNFAIKYEAYFEAKEKGKYKFYINSDDGSILWVDDKQVVNNDGDHGTKERADDVELEPGFHKVTVGYFNAGGGAWLDVFYKGPGIPKQIISPETVYPEIPS